MSLTNAVQRGKGQPHFSRLKSDEADKPAALAAKTNLSSAQPARLSSAVDRSIDDWVAHEKATCSHSRAAEAAKRIRAVQRDKSCAILDLYNHHLHSFPPLSGCQHVTYYNLVANYLMRVPEDIGDLPNLQSLSLESNGLREVPPLTKYRKLRSLGLGGNPILEMPSNGLKRDLYVSTNETLVDKWQRKEYRRGQRRLKIQSFLRRRLACLPSCCFSQATGAAPTFDGGGALRSKPEAISISTKKTS